MWFKKLFISFCILVASATCGTSVYSANDDAVSVPAGQGPTMAQPEFAVQTLKSEIDAASFPAITLEPVASARLQALKEQESLPTQIGFNRNIAMLSTAGSTGRQLNWHPLPGGGQYTGIKIISPQALALRVGMTVDTLPESTEIRFFGVQDGDAVNIQLVSAREILNILKTNREADPVDPDGKIFWSPTIKGDTLGVEIFLPGDINPSSVQIALPLISHISILPYSSPNRQNSVQGYGDSNACQNDATCEGTWKNLNKSVAGMQFSTGAGTFICTGSLLNDLDDTTWKPYFITANHCLSTQATASTLETHWFKESSTCNGTTLSSSYKKITGGAVLLHTQGMSPGEPTSNSMDTTLMKLNNAPPSGAWFAGWTTDPPPGVGTARTGIHHPKGDWKKISHATSGGDAACGWFNGSVFGCRSGSGNFYMVNWTDGGTEGGSSGSALYADTSYLIGMLSGGNGSCEGSSSYYSSFRAAYSAGDYGQWLYTDPPAQSEPVTAPTNYLLLRKL